MHRREIYDKRRALRTVFVTTAKRAGRPGALWGLLFGASAAGSAISYTSAFPTAISRAQLALSFQGNTAWAALFGPLRRLDTVAGYTAYKSGMFLVILGAIWGLLVATRLLRGEEDAGRWELFLSGQTTRAGAALQAAIGLAVGLVALWVPTALLSVAAGASSKVNIGLGASLFFATSAVAGAAMFMAIGLFVGQLAATRRDANLIGACVLAASYLIRMAADSDAGLAWLRWVSPIGWIEELRPLTGSRPFAFLPIVVLVAVLVVLAIRIAGRRDLGASALASRDTSKPRTLLLGGQAGLTVRLTRPVIAAWVVALIVTGLVFGLVAQAAGAALRGWRWLAVRLGVGLGLVVVASVLAGLAAWVGAVSQHADVGLGELLKAGLNVVPPAVFVLGIGGLTFSVWPRGAIGVTYGLVVWSFFVETIAGVFDSNHWLRDTSPLLHISPVPAAEPNWTAAAWLVGLGVVAGLAGIAAFRRRDLVGA